MSTIKTLGTAKDLCKPAFVKSPNKNRTALVMIDGNYAWVGSSDVDTDPKELYLTGKIYTFVGDDGNDVYGITTKSIMMDEIAIVFDEETVEA